MDSTVCIGATYSSGLKSVKPLEPELTAVIPMWFNKPMEKRRGHARPTESEVEAIARRLRNLQMASSEGGLTPGEVCAVADIQLPTYSNWINARGAPSRLEARKLKRALGWSLDYIYEGDISGLPAQIALRLGREAALKTA